MILRGWFIFTVTSRRFPSYHNQTPRSTPCDEKNPMLQHHGWSYWHRKTVLVEKKKYSEEIGFEDTPIWVFPKIGVTPKSSILIGFSIINHPFWDIPIFGNTYIRISPSFQGDLRKGVFLFFAQTSGKVFGTHVKSTHMQDPSFFDQCIHPQSLTARP